MKVSNNIWVSAETSGEALITSLPDSILLHILSLLPTMRDAAKTSILSTNWGRFWSSIQHLLSLKYGGELFQGYDRGLACFVDECLQKLRDLNHKPNSLVLIFNSVKSSQKANLITRWVQAADNLGLKELVFEDKSHGPCPRAVLLAAHVQALTLRLCILTNPITLQLSSLRGLTLTQVQFAVDDNDYDDGGRSLFQCLLHSCPLLLNLEIVRCFGLKRIDIVAHPCLQHVRISTRAECIRICETPTLLSLGCCCRDVEVNLEIRACTNLKKVCLDGLITPMSFYEKLVSSLPSLESLKVLLRRDDLDCLTISSTSLKQLTIVGCSYKQLRLVNAHCPNLSTPISKFCFAHRHHHLPAGDRPCYC